MKRLQQAAWVVVIFALTIQAAAALLRPVMPSVLVLGCLTLIARLLSGRRL